MKRVLFFFLFSVLAAVTTAQAIELKDIRYSHSKKKTRFVLEFSRLPSYRLGILKDPFRIFFDLDDVESSFKKNEFEFSKGPVITLRLGRKDRGIRVVFDLKQRVQWKAFTLKSPPRLVIDLFHRSGPLLKNTKNPELKIPERKPVKTQWIVFLDPGHGGHDPGAIGPGGIKEKDIVLKVSRMVKTILERTYNVKVYLSRQNDRYLSLEKRTQLANRVGADLFVSIHLNAHEKSNVRGIETYILNWTNDREALMVAARENKVSIKEMMKKTNELSVILASLKRSAKRDYSLKLAYYIHNEILKKVGTKYRMPDNGIKQALFYVLVGAEMPSVLMELAYVSNPAEARLLRSRKVQKEYAEAIAKAIYRYLMSLPEAPKLAMLKDNLRQYD